MPKRCNLAFPFLEFKVDSDKGTIEGYGSTFGNVDLGGDRVEVGAFKASLNAHKKAKTMPGMYWCHDSREPIGQWEEMEEDEKGLFVKGSLFVSPERSTECVRKAWNMACSNGPKGLSIGYNPEKWAPATDEEGKTCRSLKKIALVEVSLVPFGMNPKAILTNAKELGDGESLLLDENGEPVTLRDAEAIARDALGLSRKEAATLLQRGYQGFLQLLGKAPGGLHRDDADLSGMISSLQEATRKVRGS